MTPEILIEKIKKRDGTIVQFDKQKIFNAVIKAEKAVSEDGEGDADQLTDLVIDRLIEEVKINPRVLNVEEIQDIVERILIKKDKENTAKAYILYRKQREEIRKARSLFLDVNKVMDTYILQDDWRVKENSNISYSSSGLLMHLSGTLIAHYVLNRLYPHEISQAHSNGDFHIHDLSMGIMGYCAGWSLKQILLEGFNGVPGKMDSVPPKHLNSVIWMMINFVGTLQNEWAGAQAFSSFDTYLAPFVKSDNLSYDETKQCVQAFVFNMNIPSRWGGQTPFSNITLDWVVPEDMKDKKALIAGNEADFTYGDCQKEMDMINKAFIEVMMAGDAKGRIFTFPIPTYNITRDFEWDNENANLLFEMAAKYGTPYFQNFVNSDLNPGDVRSMCCRLQMDMRELRNKTGGLFGSGELTGSLGVVTINLPRIGYLSKTEDEFFHKLEHLMDLAEESLEIKRKIVQKNIDDGFMPYTKRYLGNLNNHFSTIGIVGMNEALMNFFGEDAQIYTEKGKAFAEKVLDFMRGRISEYQEKTGHIYNLEATPAEGTSYRLAKIDKEKYPEIITQGKETPYYTNSTQLPVGYTEDVFEALELQDSLQIRYTGGTVLHGFLGERVSNPETCKQLVKRVAYNFRLPYFTITPTFSVCPKHGYIEGEHEYCPKCDEEAIIDLGAINASRS